MIKKAVKRKKGGHIVQEDSWWEPIHMSSTSALARRLALATGVCPLANRAADALPSRRLVKRQGLLLGKLNSDVGGVTSSSLHIMQAWVARKVKSAV